MSRPRTRTGFTLVEMLVVITIIGTLMAMLLPAIQAARATARAVVCRSQLENLYTAVDAYASSAGAGQYPGYQNAVGTQGQYGSPATAQRAYNSNTPGRKASWVVPLLPYLDQSATFDEWTTRPLHQPAPFVYMEVLNCPQDISQAEQNFPALSYVANAGFGWTVDVDGAAQTVESIYDGPFLDRYDDDHDQTDNRKPNLTKTMLSQGMDGTQYTLLISENLHEARQPNTLAQPANTWGSVEPPHGDASLDPTYFQDLAKKRYTVFLWFDQAGTVEKINGDKYTVLVDNGPAGGGVLGHKAARPASFHTGGVNVVFAGGNSQFLRETIDYTVFQQLCTPSDKRSELATIYSPLPPPLSDSSFQ